MNKDLLFRQEARTKLLEGVKILADAVTTTLGAKGKNVAIEKQGGQYPLVVHDGVTVAKEVNLSDKFQNLGAQLVKQAAIKTNDTAGDGTTTATLLAYVMVKEGMNYLTTGGDPMALRDELHELSKTTIASLVAEAKQIKTRKEIAQVAMVSSVSKEIGDLIAEAIERVGKTGLVVVEKSNETAIEVEYKEGMEFDNGYLSPYFISNPTKMTSEIADAFVLVTDKKMTVMDDDLMKFLNKFVSECGQKKNLVIIADEVSGEALAGLVINRFRGVVNVLAVRAPGYGEQRTQMLQDIAILTGANVITSQQERTFESIEIAELGKADKIVADELTTKIVGGKGSKKALKERIEHLRTLIEKEKLEYKKDKLEERLAKLTGGVAVVKVGASTEVELNELYERVIDAVGAAQSAVDEGIVAGGGIALLRYSDTIFNLSPAGKIFCKALAAPAIKILDNAGADYAFSEIIRHTGDFGWNVQTKEYGSMIKMGILDPVKVTRLALENAVSVATMILTTDVLITLKEEKKNG